MRVSDVLSQKQIDKMAKTMKNRGDNASIKKQAKDVNISKEELTLKKSHKDITVYDFTSPKRYTREQLKILDNIFDNIERLISLKLSGMLRVNCSGEVVDTAEGEYKQYIDSLDDLVLVGVVNISSAEQHIDGKQFLIQIERQLSFSIIDRMLGGDGSCYNIQRDYTDIEMSLLERLFLQILPQFSSAWGTYAEMSHELESIETNSRTIQSLNQEETVVLLEMELTIKDISGKVTVCIPSGTMDVMIKVFESKYAKNVKKGDIKQEENRKARVMGAIKKSTLAVTGVLGQTEIQLQELLDLQQGDIFLLNKATKDKSVSVHVEGEPWFTGQIGVYKKNYAVKIDKVTLQK